jgi:SLOG cluster3 family
MSGPRVFVSAGFPSGERGEKFLPYDPGAIGFAMTEVVRAVLRAEGRIVFGAQPAISPLVLQVAVELGRRNVVDVYQSRFFEKRIPGETMRLVEEGYAVPQWTERVPGVNEEDPCPSLELMRTKMLMEADPPDAAVFIGGMEGIIDEYQTLRDRSVPVPLLPLTAPGGAARTLQLSHDPVAERLTPFLGSPYYSDVARRIVAALAQ